MIRNVHERVINAPLEPLGVLLDGLGQKDDRLWPSRYWPPMVLDRPLALGADGGHDDIYYYVSEYEPGRRVRFSFRPRTGIIGAHELSLDALDEGARASATSSSAVPVAPCASCSRPRSNLCTTPSSRTSSTTPNARPRARSSVPRRGPRGCACCAASPVAGSRHGLFRVMGSSAWGCRGAESVA